MTASLLHNPSMMFHAKYITFGNVKDMQQITWYSKTYTFESYAEGAPLPYISSKLYSAPLLFYSTSSSAYFLKRAVAPVHGLF